MDLTSVAEAKSLLSSGIALPGFRVHLATRRLDDGPKSAWV